MPWAIDFQAVGPAARRTASYIPAHFLVRVLLLVLGLGNAQARDLHVSPSGDDHADGLAQPVKTIARAIRLAEPGDTIHLDKAVYHESAEFGKKSGEPEKPIVLDGHGATLEGSEQVLAKDWELVSPGLYRKVHLFPKTEDFVIQRWFMVWDGKMNHMGRTSKGHRDPLKAPAELQIDEWTYVKDEDAFYVRIAPDRDLDKANIRYPARSSGVAIGGATDLVIRDVICTHVFNDGFNIHGSARHCLFQNIRAIDCGDDGFSAHEDAECKIEGFFSAGNSTGFTDIGSSKTRYERVRVQGCLAFDFLFQGDGEHHVRDAAIFPESQTPFGLGAGNPPGAEPCRLTLENVFYSGGKPYQIKLPANTKLTANRCTFIGFLPIESKGELALNDCIVIPNLSTDGAATSPTKGGADLNKLMAQPGLILWCPDPAPPDLKLDPTGRSLVRTPAVSEKPKDSP